MSPLAAAAPFVGVPYLPLGRTPEGWDCWGCGRWCRRAIFGQGAPSWDDAYDLSAFAGYERLIATSEALILERLSAWSPQPRPAPGHFVLIEVFGRAAHVGLMLTGHDFIHAWEGVGTAIESVRSPRWARRVRGFYDA